MIGVLLCCSSVNVSAEYNLHGGTVVLSSAISRVKTPGKTAFVLRVCHGRTDGFLHTTTASQNFSGEETNGRTDGRMNVRVRTTPPRSGMSLNSPLPQKPPDVFLQHPPPTSGFV